MSLHPILVTGATGHIGNVLVRKLVERGEHVRALVPPGEDAACLRGLDLELVRGDVLDSPALGAVFEGVRRVFHLAGVISILPEENPMLWRVNVEGTMNILRAAMHARVERLVYTSSIHALARLPHGQTVDEHTPYDPENPYGPYDRSKARATLQVQLASRAGLDAVIACPTGVIGPYDFRGSMLGNVIRSAAYRQPTPYVDGAYDFVDVRDVADGLLAAADHGRKGASYILSGQRISVRYLLDTVQEITGKGFTRFKVPLPLAEFTAKFMPWIYLRTRTSPRFTPYSLEVLQSNSFISHALATRELGYQPRPLFDSIRDTVQWLFTREAEQVRQTLP